MNNSVLFILQIEDFAVGSTRTAWIPTEPFDIDDKWHHFVVVAKAATDGSASSEYTVYKDGAIISGQVLMNTDTFEVINLGKHGRGAQILHPTETFDRVYAAFVPPYAQGCDLS